MTIRPAAGPLSPGQARAAAILCFLVAGLEGYDIQSFGIAAPALSAALGLRPDAVGLAASAAMVGLVAGAFVGGWLAERRGPKLVLVLSTLLFALFSLATAAVQSFEGLLVARFLTGLGFGGAMPNLLAVATRLRPEGRHAALTTAIFCGMPVGGAIVATIARFMGAEVDWRLLFAIGGIAPLALVPLLIWLLPDFPPAERDRGSDALGTTLFAQGRWRHTLLLWIAFALTLLLLYLLLNWLPTLAVAKRFTAANGASASLAFNLCGIAGSLALGAAANRAGFRWPIAIGFAILVGGILAMALGDSVTILLISAGMMGGAVIGLQYLLYAMAPMDYPPAMRIAAAGAAIGMGRLGSIAGPLLAGTLRQHGMTADAVFLLAAPIAVLAGIASILAAPARVRNDRAAVVR